MSPAFASEVTTLVELHDTFRKWLGDDYDTDSIDVVLAALVVDRGGELWGDPVWPLIVSGSGNAKTETVQAAAGAGAKITSSITGEAALLSGSPDRDKNKTSTGGLLREIGSHGVLVLKDFTTMLSMDRTARNLVMSALREIYDGYWDRHVGANGGQILAWSGRLTIIGAVTTAWDAHHAVIGSMGDRFITIRTDSDDYASRMAAGLRAQANRGHETEMRDELAHAVGSLVDRADLSFVELGDGERGRTLAAAELVTRARTETENDYRGEPQWAHAPEMPTRFAKQLDQIVAAIIALGGSSEHALNVALRCAVDSIPPDRLTIMRCVSDAGAPMPIAHIARETGFTRRAVGRICQQLTLLKIFDEDDEPYVSGQGNGGERRVYSLKTGMDMRVLTPPQAELMPAKQ